MVLACGLAALVAVAASMRAPGAKAASGQDQAGTAAGDGQADVDEALRKGAGAEEGHLSSAVELEVFLVIVTLLVALSVALESLEHFLLHSTPTNVRIILGVLYGELTTFGTVGILFFVAESTGLLKSIGSSVFGKTHAEALVERVERVDKVLLLLILVFVVTCLVLVWRAWVRTDRYEALEALARTPERTLAGAVMALEADPAARTSVEGRSSDAGASASTARPVLHSAPSFTSRAPLKPVPGAPVTFSSAAEAVEAVEYLSLRHQFLYRLRRQRSPPVTPSFSLSAYLGYSLGQDMAGVVNIQIAAWLLLLLLIFLLAPVMLLGSPAAELAVFVAVGVAPCATLAVIGWHMRHARRALVDPTLLLEVARRAKAGAGAAAGRRGGADSAAGGSADSVGSADGAMSLRHRAVTSGSASAAAGAASVSAMSRAEEGGSPPPGRGRAAAAAGSSAHVAHGWPLVQGLRADYRALAGASPSAPCLSCDADCWSLCCGGARLSHESGHARLLWFGSRSPAAFSFLLTFTCLVSSVYVAVLLGGLSLVFSALLGPWLALAVVLALLVPPALFAAQLAGVVADLSVVVSVEELVRPDAVRSAVVQQQAALAGSAVRVLACLANSEALKQASRLTPDEQRARFEQSRAALGAVGFDDAMTEAARMFRAFLPAGRADMDRDALRSLLTSLGLVGRGTAPGEDDAFVTQVLSAMDTDTRAEAGAEADEAGAGGGEAGAGADEAGAGEAAGLIPSPTVSLSEFQHWYVVHGPGAPLTADDDIDELAGRVFRSLDKDGSGSLSMQELRDAIGGIDDLDVEAVLAAWDKDRSGDISEAELRDALRESLR